MKFVPLVIIFLSFIFLAGCNDQDKNIFYVASELTDGDNLYQVICDAGSKQCKLVALNAKKKLRLISEDLSFSWGYHSPSISLALSEHKTDVLVTIDHDFGENILLQKFTIPEAGK